MFTGLVAAVGILITTGALLLAQAVSDQAETRLPVPPRAEQQEPLDAINEVYEIDKKKTDEEKAKLVAELLEALAETKNRPTDQFVLLRMAMEIAADAGDAPLTLELVDRIATDFQIDPLMTKGKMLQAIAKQAKTADRIASLVDAANGYIDQAVAQKRFDYAQSIAALTYRATQQAQGREFRTDALARYRRVQKLHASGEKLQKALLAVQANPDNPAANLAVGQLYCFVHGDWKRGLSYLGKGSDATLAALARQELAPPATGAEQVKLADGWWDLAQRSKNDEKSALIDHAASWYEKAQSGTLTGLTELKVSKRLEQIAKMQSTRKETPRATGRLPLALRKGLVLHYTFDRDDGNKVTDKSGQNNHGAAQGPKWMNNARGPRNPACVFVGKNDLIALPLTVFGNGNALTLSVWVNSAPYSGSSWPGFIASHTTSEGKNIFLGINRSSGNLFTEIDTDRGNYSIAGGTLRVPWKQWFHAALVYNGTSMTEYLNGVPGKSVPASGNLKTPQYATIGKYCRSAATLTGGVDDVMIFRRALTPKEIVQLYKLQGGR